MRIDRRNDLSLKLIEVFGAVMEHGTTTDAAEHLGVSQPAVSNCVRSLEKQLGLLLFERAGRQLRPTEEAHLLYAESQPIFGMLRRLASEVHELKHNRYVCGSQPLLRSGTPSYPIVCESCCVDARR